MPQPQQTHLPVRLLNAIDDFMADVEFSLYVLDGQHADSDGGDDDWHDALALAEPNTSTHLHDRLVKFTQKPDGEICYYYPMLTGDEIVISKGPLMGSRANTALTESISSAAEDNVVTHDRDEALGHIDGDEYDCTE